MFRTDSTVKSRNNSVFSRDVTAAMLVSLNKETVAMLVSQTNPLGIQLYSCANELEKHAH